MKLGWGWVPKLLVDKGLQAGAVDWRTDVTNGKHDECACDWRQAESESLGRPGGEAGKRVYGREYRSFQMVE